LAWFFGLSHGTFARKQRTKTESLPNMHYRLLITFLLCCCVVTLFAQRTPTGATQAAPATQDRQRGSTPARNDAPRSSDRSSSTKNDDKSARSSNSTQDRSGNNSPAQTRIGRQMQNNEQLRKSSGSRPAQQELTAKGSSTNNNLKKTAPTAPKSVEVGKVNWMTLEQAMEKNKTEKRKIYVDVYTDWCGWCKKMDSTSFVHPAVAKYLNEHYWPVKFNAEQQQDITFNGKVYHFRRNGARGVHELAIEWLNNRLSFPSSVFLDENQHTIQALSTYLDASKLEAIINYFGTDSHKKTPWEVYERNFVKRPTLEGGQ
jgi:thioredoxin-related protein